MPQSRTGTDPEAPVASGVEIPLPPPEVHFEEPSPSANTAETSSSRPSSPEHRRKIDPDLDLHHPMAVRPATEAKATSKHANEDEGLPPQIGERVPMLDFAGDVQAPTPLPPDSRSASRAKRRIQQTPILPPDDGPIVVGDFGAYPGGKVYRQNGNYSLSHDDLMKSVMTAKGAGVATTPGLEGVPDEEIGYAATDEIVSRNVTPQATPGGITEAGSKLPSKSPLSTAVSVLESENDLKYQLQNLDEPESHGIYGKKSANVSSTSLGVPTSGRHTPHGNWEDFQDEHHDGTPILASDEAGKYPVWNPPAISPKLTAQEIRRPPSSTKSRQSPSVVPEDDISDPPSPIKEHVPLFPEGAPKHKALQRPTFADKQRNSSFPSKDIWEDAPESYHVTYEVLASEEDSKQDPEYYDPREARLREEAAKAASEPAKDGAAAPPPLPTHRPTKRVPADETSPVSPESKQAPSIPERVKPSIPPRPSRKTGEPTSAITESPTSPEEPRSLPATKPKPMVPPKVGGGIAALRANFMSDLNSRLSKGPVVPKKEEPAADAAEAEPKDREPLEDVRKTRARGPAKRKPTAAAGSGDAAPAHIPKLTFSSIITVYSIGEDYEVSFDETKFDDEPSKIARPIEEKIIDGLKGGEDIDTSKQVTAVDTSAAIVPEGEKVEEVTSTEAATEPTEESKLETTEAKAVTA